MAKEVITKQETTTTAPAAPATTPISAVVEPKGLRSYLVMMLLAVLMLPSGLARAYRGEQIGWTRFWIYVGATVACVIPFLNILGILAVIVLTVWGAIDVFKLYKERTDADGAALLTTPRDEKFAKGFFIYFIVGLIATGVGVLVALIFGAFIATSLMNATGQNFNRNDYYNSNPYYREFDRSER